MNKQEMADQLRITLKEWQNILDNQGESWDNYDRQEGEIDGLLVAIDLIEENL